MRLHRILVPVDFSAPSEQAALVALELANRHHAALTLLHVDPLPGAATVAVEPVYIPADLFTGLRADYDRRIDEGLTRVESMLRARAAPEVEIRHERRTGGVTDGVIEIATEQGADLVVMGSSGLTGAARLLLGSVAEKTSRAAPCPVLITRARNEEERQHGPFRNVLVGVDHSVFSAPITRLAVSVADPDAAIELVHVWSPPYFSALDTHYSGVETTEWVSAVSRASAEQAARLDAFREGLGLARARSYVTTGNVASALLDRADEIGADLVVVGAHGRRDLRERLLGTTSDRVLRHAPVAVLLMPEQALPAWSEAPAPERRAALGL